jgi:hypothetical protein
MVKLLTIESAITKAKISKILIIRVDKNKKSSPSCDNEDNHPYC